MEKLKETIGLIFNNMLLTLDQTQVQLQIREILHTKRSRCKNKNEYVDTLLQHVTFNVEYSKAIRNLYAKELEEKKQPSAQEYQNMLAPIPGDISQRMALLLPTYKQIIENEHTINQKIAKLEMLYGTTKIGIDLLAMFLETSAKETNIPFFEPLYEYDPDHVSEVMREYADFHGASLLDGVFVKGQPLAK